MFKKKKSFDARMSNLHDIIEIQASDGNWNYSAYMFGVLNGLILAESIMSGLNAPAYRDSPDYYLEDMHI